MTFSGLPCVSTYADVTGHAHPSLMGAKVANTEDEGLSHLHNLVSGMPLHIVPRGFADEGLTPTSALVYPQVRRSPLGNEVVQHLDIVSCWKGLSQSQTLELTIWARLFRESLASHIKYHLQHDLTEQLSGYPGSTNEALLIPRIVNLLSREHTLMVKVSMTDLVHEMISLLYNTHRSETLHRKFDWSLSSGNLPDFVLKFVRTQDCFHHALDGSFVFFDSSYSYTVGNLTAFADLHWRLPRITFSALPTRLVNGETYRIIPHFADASSSATAYSGVSTRKDDITYSVTKSPLPLQWDFTHDCFHVPVLHDSPDHDEVLETILSAKITTSFHAGVRFERVSRYNIKLEVGTDPSSSVADISRAYAHCDSNSDRFQNCHAPWLDPRLQRLFGSPCGTASSSPWIPSYTSTPLSKTGASTSLESRRIDENCCERKESMEGQNKDGPPAQKVFDASKTGHSPLVVEPSSPSTSEIVSPGKRKAWSSRGLCPDSAGSSAPKKLDRPNLEIDTKRRKLRQHVDSDVVMSADSDIFPWDEIEDDALDAHLARVATGLLGAARASSQSSYPHWSPNLEASDNNHSMKASKLAGKAFPATLASTKRMPLTWRGRKQHSDHSPPSSSNGSPVHEITPPVTASTTTSASTDSLSQEQIQHNYYEFEQRRKQKAAEKEYYEATIPGFDGVVSPTDVDDKTFERIFMGEDEADGWVSEDDGISERTSSIFLED